MVLNLLLRKFSNCGIFAKPKFLSNNLETTHVKKTLCPCYARSVLLTKYPKQAYDVVENKIKT